MRWFFFSLCLMLGGLQVAQAAFFTDDEARKKIAEQQQVISQLQAQNQALQAKLEEELKQRQALGGRVDEMEATLKGQGMLQLLSEIDRLNAEIGTLRGQIELMGHDIEITQKRQRELYTDTDTRLRKLESAAAPAKPTDAAVADTAVVATAGQPSVPAVAASAPPPGVDASNEQEQKEYDAASLLAKSGKHAEAENAFQQFIARHPNSKLTPNAAYWMGAAQFSQREYKQAIATQQKLVKQYPDHEKAPDALLNIANSQIQLADVDGARQTLKTLIAKYPGSRAAELGKKRLGAIESLKSKN